MSMYVPCTADFRRENMAIAFMVTNFDDSMPFP